MQYIDTHPQVHRQTGTQLFRLGYLPLLLLIPLAAYELSTGQLIWLCLAFGMGLALVERIHGLSRSASQPHSGVRKPKAFDGGAFPVEQAPTHPRQGRGIVHDGGSFERAALRR